jgi:hypothetical protein
MAATLMLAVQFARMSITIPGMPQIPESSTRPATCGCLAQACKSLRWWHLECLSQAPEESDTTELAEPNLNGRCAECIADRRYAMNRILELARMETGQYRLLLEYLGYSSYELDRPSVLDSDVMDHASDS